MSELIGGGTTLKVLLRGHRDGRSTGTLSVSRLGWTGHVRMVQVSCSRSDSQRTGEFSGMYSRLYHSRWWEEVSYSD